MVNFAAFIAVAMPEKFPDKTVFSLLEIAQSFQRMVSQTYAKPYWVKAEMNKLNFYRQSGHCYPDLVEKQDGRVVAEMRANLWRDDYQRINQLFLEVLQEPLKDGIKLLCLVSLSFDPVYGLALKIHDIDPGYTLGDLEREKQETLLRLKTEQIFDRNRNLRLALLPQRVAIISDETSKGYVDFLRVIDGNAWNYPFFHYLFPSLLQGDKAITGIIRQLDRIRRVITHFDLVVIVRGGGGDVGLSCYNNYELAKAIANFPIPVLTGIGHATNETVSEMVAYSNSITPTKLGEYLLQCFHAYAQPLQRAEERIRQFTERLLHDTNNGFQAQVNLFRSAAESILAKNRHAFQAEIQSLFRESRFRFLSERKAVEGAAGALNRHPRTFLRDREAAVLGLEREVNLLDPQQVLRRGYSITRREGRALKSSDALRAGDEIRTTLHEGNVLSRVTEAYKNELP